MKHKYHFNEHEYTRLHYELPRRLEKDKYIYRYSKLPHEVREDFYDSFDRFILSTRTFYIAIIICLLLALNIIRQI